MTTMKAQAIALARNPTLPDEEIARRVVAGDVALFEVLMRRHNRSVYRAARSILRNEAEVEDVMQQTYVAAFTNLSNFRSESKFSTWLIRIAINEALGRVRRAKARLEGEQMIEADQTSNPAAFGDPERSAANQELLRILEESIDDLPESYRIVFMLRDVEGLDTAAAAAALDLSEDVIKQRLRRARVMLRHDLHERIGRTAVDSFRFDDRRCDRIVDRVFATIAR